MSLLRTPLIAIARIARRDHSERLKAPTTGERQSLSLSRPGGAAPLAASD